MQLISEDLLCQAFRCTNFRTLIKILYTKDRFMVRIKNDPNNLALLNMAEDLRSFNEIIILTWNLTKWKCQHFYVIEYSSTCFFFFNLKTGWNVHAYNSQTVNVVIFQSSKSDSIFFNSQIKVARKQIRNSNSDLHSFSVANLATI